MPHVPRINDVLWISKNQILILLSNDWLFSTLPPLYFNNSKLLSTNLKPAPLTQFGKLTGYYKNENEITFIYYPNKEEKGKRMYVAGNFNDWEAAIGNEQWLLKPTTVDKEEVILRTVPWDTVVNLDKETFFKFVTENKEWIVVPEEAPNLTLDNHNNSNYQINNNRTGHNAFLFKPDLKYDPSLNYEIAWKEDHHTETYRIDDRVLLSTLGSTRELGAIVNSTGTTFRLFGPRATSVKVFFYDKLNPEDITQVELERNDDYTWETTWPENLQGYRYYYNVSKTQFNDTPILDPYAIACNGPGGPGIVIDRKLIPKIETNFKTPKWTDIIILEAHLRDLIKNTLYFDEFEKPAGFRNFIQWIKSDNNYIKELGINAIELLPIQEYERNNPFEYHWGYMPTNYFCPASSYAFGEDDISQITDFQHVVQTLHKQGVSVILDVVYNHSGNPNHLLNIDKDYYFETTKEGHLTNWCGCGNDFRANTPMGKRLIIDSLVYFIQTFDVDGFRFDLADLLGIEVLVEIEVALKKVKPSIILIAEPWSFRGHIGYALRSTGFAAWNDGYREFIADYVRGGGNQDAFSYFITGSISYLARFTSQSVNYASSHDDYCWIDRITENAHHDGSNPTVHDIRRTHLMMAILMMSIGIPMLAEGQDFLHSKKGHSNTYQNEYLNAMNYINMARYSNTHQYFSRWIRFRLSEYGQAMRISEIPSKGYFKFYYHTESSMMGVLYNADLSLKKVPQLLFVVNPNLKENILLLTDFQSEGFLQIGDQERLNIQGLEGGLIPWNNEQITLPALSCGLWIKIS